MNNTNYVVIGLIEQRMHIFFSSLKNYLPSSSVLLSPDVCDLCRFPIRINCRTVRIVTRLDGARPDGVAAATTDDRAASYIIYNAIKNFFLKRKPIPLFAVIHTSLELLPDDSAFVLSCDKSRCKICPCFE